MNFRLVFKSIFYLGIIASVILLWLNINLDVKFGLDNSLAIDPISTGERIIFTSDLYLSIISICIMGLLILELYRKKSN